MNFENGIFTISLDFEQYWGMQDKGTVENNRDDIMGTWDAIPEILRIFAEYNIHATWATVGFLFFESANELKAKLPKHQPSYDYRAFSPYDYINQNHWLEPKLHFAPRLIDQIAKQDGQEIGTHTFSHYYCLERGQTIAQFAEDLDAAIAAAAKQGYHLRSFIFPRNQWTAKYLKILADRGIECYRGNERSWIYTATDRRNQGLLRRMARLLDSYVNLTGPNTYRLSDCGDKLPFVFPASRFLRPYSRNLAFLEGFRLRRIESAMTYAARRKELFHLWWHPHNFGINCDQNIAVLERITKHYQYLNHMYGMQSLNMGELCLLLNSVKGGSGA